jgi:NAD-dependent SIR2 family protein deacetylase
MRGPNIMWFLGAGASRNANIPTAGDMIWDFKIRLYLSHKKQPASSIADTSDPVVRRKIQTFLDSLKLFPPEGADSEYSEYFEATYSSPRDRRTYIESKVAVGKPSFGHLALALMMGEKVTRLIWTTNFDRTVEDAAALVLGGTGKMLIADLGEPDKLTSAMSENRWPVFAKLHGDYHSDRLKNSTSELQAQDAAMRQNLVSACKSFGLAAVGYSGRDASVMEALNEAVESGSGFPQGLFWFKRFGDDLNPAVLNLIHKATSNGIEAFVVENEAFEELLSDIVRTHPDTSIKAKYLQGASPPRLSSTPHAKPSAAFPIIRTNALPVLTHPVSCRLIECGVGGKAKIDEAIAAAGVDIDAYRCKEGVLAFGRDSDIKKALEPFSIVRFDVHAIHPAKLAMETAEKSLLRDSLFRALRSQPGIRIERRGRRVFALADPSLVQPSHFNLDGEKPISKLAGSFGSSKVVKWAEACGLHIDYRLDRIWLLLEPRIILHVPAPLNPDNHTEIAEIDKVAAEAREYVRSTRAGRHNKKSNAVLEGWINLIAGNAPSAKLKGFNISDGYDPEFELGRITGFSGALSR